jgi:hypothetical protein
MIAAARGASKYISFLTCAKNRLSIDSRVCGQEMNLKDIILEGMVYDILKAILIGSIATIGLDTIFSQVFNLIHTRRQHVLFVTWVGLILTFSFFEFGPHQIAPDLNARILQVITGHDDKTNSQYAIATITIINRGTMPTVLTNWRLSMEHNGVTYDAAFPIMPDTFAFHSPKTAETNVPTSVVFEKGDELRTKSLDPIEIGSLLSGILFAQFQNVDPSIFTQEVLYKVYFQDVTGREYLATFSSTAKQSASVAVVPGIKMTAMCPVDPTATINYIAWLRENCPTCLRERSVKYQ